MALSVGRRARLRTLANTPAKCSQACYGCRAKRLQPCAIGASSMDQKPSKLTSEVVMSEARTSSHAIKLADQLSRAVDVADQFVSAARQAVLAKIEAHG